jgi:hypothetical protein
MIDAALSKKNAGVFFFTKQLDNANISVAASKQITEIINIELL